MCVFVNTTIVEKNLSYDASMPHRSGSRVTAEPNYYDVVGHDRCTNYTNYLELLLASGEAEDDHEYI